MKFSIATIKQSKWYKNTMRWISQACNKGWVASTIVLAIVWVIALIPTWIYLLIRWGIGPAGFWEELALLAVACITIGWIQGILLFFAIVGSIGIVLDEF